MDWFDALYTCQKMKMCLASLDTKRAFDDLTIKFPKHDHEEYWFGLNAYEKTHFKYISTTTPMAYVPPGSKIEYEKPCAYIRALHSREFIIQTGKCGHLRRFICAEAIKCNGRVTNSTYIPKFSFELACNIQDRIKDILGISKDPDN
ncbi:hypothetical protein KR222_003411 [Zaprionus bogoriensis]|nr:hypothetical protein KR222_003411 [Zaprionus bogoriensis]